LIHICCFLSSPGHFQPCLTLNLDLATAAVTASGKERYLTKSPPTLQKICFLLQILGPTKPYFVLLHLFFSLLFFLTFPTPPGKQPGLVREKTEKTANTLFNLLRFPLCFFFSPSKPSCLDYPSICLPPSLHHPGPAT
ncbi:hypothetical protein CCHR01_19882, partial [Colletotrichum chrysophilum]